ncbi:MAG TPA: hypothetical protein VFM18_18785 [Methanosarcina sp.]|nr:hypothetical protein [Methanosarcina sp.]
MATKLENLPLEKAHFEQFVSVIPGLNTCCKKTINTMLDLGILQVSTAFEQAIAARGGHTVVSTDKADLSDGSDAKMVTVCTTDHGKRYGAPVTNIHGKTGNLRVQVYERKQKKFYYFVIPRRAYIHIPKTSNIEIPFELDGTPRRIPGRQNVIQNWWRWQVQTFDDMCKITKPKMLPKQYFTK